GWRGRARDRASCPKPMPICAPARTCRTSGPRARTPRPRSRPFAPRFTPCLERSSGPRDNGPVLSASPEAAGAAPVLDGRAKAAIVGAVLLALFLASLDQTIV